MKVAIVGYGVEGQSAYRYLAAKGDADITVYHKERPADLPADVKVVEEASATELTGYDVVFRSPPVNPTKLHTDGRITTVTEEFMDVFGTERLIAVTGSKGKGTMSALVHAMLNAAGKRTHLGGNIGVPALDLLPDIHDGDYVVLELSSFQLWAMQKSPHIAIVGMITPDHLDVHPGFEDYVSAKANIARHQTAEDVITYHPTNERSKWIADQSPAATKLRYATPEAAHIEDDSFVIDGQKICPTSDVQIPGKHNLENICAALTAAWQVTQDVEALARAIREYKGLEHRIEFVRNLDGVDYYDDSFAASTSAAVVAAQAFEAPKVMILGGYDRGIDLAEMVDELVKVNLRKVLLIGQTAPKLRELFEAAGKGELVDELGAASMTDIVAKAQAAAQKGDVVVLSPGSASFDMFKDYKVRGNQFKEAVQAL
ncbi:MAG TPA: UDP-N-acetylmuramoyl-L-alanine--D-glutamate ligase [Candidatus Saccharimonadales bacterium]|nr:UDP-N-acetylmuramoyl-L-alanine--D-glutamate ligase [Candidatus Saccharimonadales bacterium]